MTGRILVVDDDTALAEMIGIVLTGEGFDTTFCSDGALAVDAWRVQKPELVLLDLMLPGKDGIEICREIRAERRLEAIACQDDANHLCEGGIVVHHENATSHAGKCRTRA